MGVMVERSMASGAHFKGLGTGNRNLESWLLGEFRSAP